ncbi:MAG: D-tyrosyl-tRNA(Tyr) deacylase [Planctomycetes bacterium]|nr:D-tyrosyl-tRNA(Tyr) deacylase [Planctomycetota bacterium]
MRAVVQRVHEAKVVVGDSTVSSMQTGLLIYLGISKQDTAEDVTYMAKKIRHLRVFSDDKGKPNRDVKEANGDIMVVSAFTTQADARKGRRPSLAEAAEPEIAKQFYEHFCDVLGELGVTVHTGKFREHMDVVSSNDGPICILIDSKKAF